MCRTLNGKKKISSEIFTGQILSFSIFDIYRAGKDASY